MYVSTESSKPEVYLSSRESPGVRVQVSVNGGVQPRWRRDGREIFYVGSDSRLMSVGVGAGSPPRLSSPAALFQTHIDARSHDALEHFDYDVSPDGQRIVTLAHSETEAVTPWTVVINWPAGLNQPQSRQNAWSWKQNRQHRAASRESRVLAHEPGLVASCLAAAPPYRDSRN